MKFIIRFIPASLLALPMFVLAGEARADLGFFTNLVNSMSGLVNLLIPFVVALALLFFFWGVFTYFILGAGDEAKRETGRSYMVYGLIGLVAIVAVWGLVQLIVQVLGVDASKTFTAPKPPI